MLSDEDFKLWLPVILAVLTAFFGIIAFWIQKTLERRAKYKLDVQDRYERYLHSIFDVMAKPQDKDRDAAFQKMRVSLRLFASADVLRRAQQFEDHVTRTVLAQSPNDLAASLVNAMRNHVLPRALKSDSISDFDMKRLSSFHLN